MPQVTTTEPLLNTVKEMAVALGRSDRYVTDMKRAGFRLPATRSEAIEFIRRYGPVTRYRESPPTRSQLYSHTKPPSRKE